MPELIQTFTIERRLFRPDRIPWPALLTQSSQDKMRTRYKLSSLGQELATPGGGRIVAPKGEFSHDGKAYLIEQLAIEPTAFEAQVAADSDFADAFFEDVLALFREVDPSRKLEASQELARTYQTIAVARLSLPWEKLLSHSVNRFVADVAVPRLSRPDAEAAVELRSLSWLVTYKTGEREYSLSPRVLTIEPRAGTRPEEMLYYTISPTDFRGHIGILEALEQTMAAAEGDRGKRQTRVRPARQRRST